MHNQYPFSTPDLLHALSPGVVITAALVTFVVAIAVAVVISKGLNTDFKFPLSPDAFLCSLIKSVLHSAKQLCK